MKPITLNVASRPFRNNTIVGSVVGGIAAALLLATAYNLYFFLHYGSSSAHLEEGEVKDREMLARAETEEAKLSQEIRGRDFRRLYDRGRFANDMILKRSFSWTLLFNKLETVVPPDVMMTAIRPNIAAEGIVVRVDGVAKSSGAFITLQEKLLSNRAFGRVYPISERKLNPNRPELTFALNFGYLPKVAAAPAEVVAEAAGPGEPAAPAPAASPGAGAARAAAPPEKETAAIGTVGRDGRPRTPDLLARLVVAPGGVYVPSGARLDIHPSTPGGAGPDPKDRKGPKAIAARPRGAGAAPAPPAAAPAATPAPPTRKAPQAPRPAPGTAAAPAAAAAPVVAQAPAQPPPVVIRREPGLAPPPGPRGRPGSRAQEAGKGAAPAVRLDVPLTFSARPVKEIYDALSRAHGVRFQIEAGVNPEAKVSADLAGRSLGEAIAIVAKAAGHKVTRQVDGVYRVVVSAGGEPIADRPIREESLPASGVKP